MYDENNVFAKILDGRLPSKKIYEDNNVLCFEDIAKAAPVHWLVIPKKKYVNFHDFTTKASPDEIATFFQTIAKIAEEKGLEEHGYRLVTNCGEGGGQVVFHFHVHILAGKLNGKLL